MYLPFYIQCVWMLMWEHLLQASFEALESAVEGPYYVGTAQVGPLSG
jgi:hypothetical protein